MGPKIVFSYGMTKCGSTLAFELARSGLELAGYAQPKLKADGISEKSRINFAHHLDHDQLDQIWQEIQEIGHPVVIKTHCRPDPSIIKAMEQGIAIAQATYRDPRDMALSMLDHGNRSRSEGRMAFSEITDMQSALLDITSQVDSLTQWLVRPNCLPLYYEDLAFDMNITTRHILAQLLLEIPAAQVARFVRKSRFTQMNKGIQKRFVSEMPASEIRTFRKTFAPFLKTLIRRRQRLVYTGAPILPDGTILIAN